MLIVGEELEGWRLWGVDYGGGKFVLSGLNLIVGVVGFFCLG